jgi:MFS family permease
MKPLTTPLLRRFGFRAVLTVDAVLSGLTVLACGFLSAGTPVAVIWGLLLLTGGFRSLGLTGLFTLPFVDITPTQRTAATTLSAVHQQVSLGLGVAFGGVALQASLLARGAGPDALAMSDFRFAFAAVALIGLLALPSLMSLSRDAGAEVSGHRAPARAR